MGRVVVTGATGFVGGRIVRRLRRDGGEVTALVRRRRTELEELGAAQVLADLDDVGAVTAAMEDADAVVHAAATAQGDLEDQRRVNRDGTAAMVEATLGAGAARFVHVSTTSVYDRARAPELITEEAPLVAAAGPGDASAPHPYAVTKAEAEVAVAGGTRRGLSTAILRPPSVLGAGPTSMWGAAMPRRARDGELPPEHPAHSFGWVAAEDLVDAVVAALDADVVTVTNVVGGHTTWGVYVDAIRALFPGCPPPPEPAIEPWTGWYAADRLPEVLGVSPERRFDEAMAEIARWWQSR